MKLVFLPSLLSTPYFLIYGGMLRHFWWAFAVGKLEGCNPIASFIVGNIVYEQMETIIKQAEDERNESLEMAKRLHLDYKPVKDGVDRMRMDIGLHRLPDLHEEEDNIAPE